MEHNCQHQKHFNVICCSIIRIRYFYSYWPFNCSIHAARTFVQQSVPQDTQYIQQQHFSPILLQQLILILAMHNAFCYSPPWKFRSSGHYLLA
uniref:Uncharacterized protein n=1 Tax=Rhizophora mucronata TaxID=61149 RepID=A0A2P2PYX7_RHIMU